MPCLSIVWMAVRRPLFFRGAVFTGGVGGKFKIVSVGTNKGTETKYKTAKRLTSLKFELKSVTKTST